MAERKAERLMAVVLVAATVAAVLVAAAAASASAAAAAAASVPWVTAAVGLGRLGDGPLAAC